MAEYIDREAFLEHMKGTSRYFTVKFDIENFPSADVAPVRHAHRVDNGGFYYRCSECGGVLTYGGNYCPNCGARMGQN